MNLQVILVVVLLGGGLIGMGGYIVNSQIEARVVAEGNYTKEKVRADLSQKQLQRMEAALATERERQLELQTELQAARDSETKATEVLEDRARINRLTQAKPGLLERLARKATTKVWADIEEESRN